MSANFNKDPDAIENFTVDWALALGSDTISSSTWIVPSGMTQVAASNTTVLATIQLSGGTLGSTYAVVNRITTTTSGETLDETINVYILAA